MKITASTTISPQNLMKKVQQVLPENKKKVFTSMVETAVNLGASNSKNFAAKDLARLQVADLAKKYAVEIIWR